MRQHLRNFKKLFLLALLLQFTLKAGAINYYSRTASGFWTSPGSWSTVTYGDPTNTGTFPKKGDLVFIGDGHRIVMDMNAVCASVIVGQGASGQLEFSNYLSFTITIAGSLTINNGGIVNYSGNSSRTHNMFVSRHITNNGTLDLFSDNDDFVNLVFNSSVNSVISGIGTFELNNVTLSKNNRSFIMEAQVSTFENAIRNLILSSGVYIHANSNTFNMTSGASSVTIGTNAILRVPQGVVNAAPDGDYLYLEGGIEINGGTVVVGNANGLQGIHYRKTGAIIPYIDLSQGMLEVRGGITCASSDPDAQFSFTMSGGDVLLNSGSTGAAGPLFNINDVAGSSFTMINGKIVIQNPNTTPSLNTDFSLCGTEGTVNVFSGTVEFGNTFTNANAVFSFAPFPGVVQPNFHVTGAVSNAIVLCTAPNAVSDFQLLSLQIDANKIFDIRSIAGTAGDSKAMTLTNVMDGVNAFYNDGIFCARAGNVQFQSSEGQGMGGISNTVFYDLTVNNSYGLVINSNMEVGNLLQMSDGIIYSSATYPVVLNPTGNATIGSAISFVDGPVKKQVSSLLPQNITFPVGKGAAYRSVILNLQLNTTALTEFTTEVWNSSARNLGFTLPSDLLWVSDVRYFTIVPSNTNNLVSARLTLSYDTDDVVNDYMNLRVARDDGAGAWINSGGTATGNATGSITSGTFTSFNTLFTLSNPQSGLNSLPVEMISFRGKQQDHYNFISWSTASEVNSSHFELQRSFDGRNFETLSKITAAGNTTLTQNYSYRDYNVSRSAYYRLKQVDLDGAFAWSDIIMVAYSNTASILAYPNPSSNGQFSIRLQQTDDFNIVVSDMSGRILPLSFHRSGNELKPDSALSSGVYLIRTGSGADDVTRLVVAETE
jgi:hypothetical protein